MSNRAPPTQIMIASRLRATVSAAPVLPPPRTPSQRPSRDHHIAGKKMQSVVVALALSGAAALVAPSRPAARAAPLEAATISLPATVKPGVVTGEALVDLLSYAKEKGFAIPAVNAVSSCGINACMEAAAKFGGPMIVQFSRGGGQFLAGKYIGNQEPDKASVAGCVAGALQVRQLAELYGVPVILHTDHCMRDWLPWFDGLLEVCARCGNRSLDRSRRWRLHVASRAPGATQTPSPRP